MKVRWIIRCNYRDEPRGHRLAARSEPWGGESHRGVIRADDPNHDGYFVLMFTSREDAEREANQFQLEWGTEDIHPQIVARRVP